MQTVSDSTSLPQVPARPVGEILAGLVHPLALAAARLEWLASDDEKAVTDSAAFGNPCNAPFLRLRSAALTLAAEQCRSALRWGYPTEGTGYAPALTLLRELADDCDGSAHREARPAAPDLPSAWLAQMRPALENQALTVASYRADAALLRFAASILERETPPTVRELVS